MIEDLKALRVFLLEDSELIDVMDADTMEEAEKYIRNEGTLGLSYYVVELDKCNAYHVERDLRSGEVPIEDSYKDQRKELLS
jgi:acyl-CoA reductase-like NAD-dependent aldehyde dehydrogenase